MNEEEKTSTLEALAKAQKDVAAIRQAHTEAAAEFEKTKERLLRNHATELERAPLKMASKMFAVADNLDRMVNAAQFSSDASSFVNGLTLIRDQFFRTLQEFGVIRFDPRGERFDPNRHDAVSIIEIQDEVQAGIVVDVIKPGYIAGDQVLRASEVVVGKLSTETSNE